MNNQVHYCFDTSAPFTNTQTIDVMRSAFAQAQQEINALGECLVFIERPTCDLSIETIWVGSYSASSCYMSSGPPTKINLGWCNGISHKGSMIHEIGHALGLGHEHKRPDRDKFIFVNFDLITPDWTVQYTACKLPIHPQA